MSAKDYLVIFLVPFLLELASASSGEVMGCGGFVKSSKSNIDLSRIHIGLFEKRNNNLRKVESTDCAPNNGYYFLPVSPDDRGTFVLKAIPPRGWKVEPAEFELSIDGENDQCSKGIDMNFEFIGFGITGSVLSQGSNSGPKDITIELLKSDQKTVLATALTDSDGKFDFFGVTPGDYMVKISSQVSKNLAFDALSRKIHVGEDVGIVEPFNIMGYNVEGQVLGTSSNPQKGVIFNLMSLESSQILAKVTSDQLGIIRFNKVPVGTYEIELDSTLKDTIELKENKQTIEVGHQNANLEDFVVKSFTLKGQVMAGKKPLKDVKINIETENSKQELISKTDGSFELKGISKAPITLKAVLDGYDFDTVTINNVEPGLKLDALKPARFRLSGKVDRAGFSHEITVKFKDEKTAETIGKVSVTEKGQFSIYLPPGSYSVAVEISAAEQAKIGFAPLEHKVKVEELPVGDLNFYAIKADIEGKVMCLENDCGQDDLIVSLVLDGMTLQKSAVNGQNSNFKFTGVLPGSYILKISDNDKCWDEVSKTISVSENVKNIVFQQVGYYVSVESSRSTQLEIKGIKSKQIQMIAVNQGQTMICVKTTDPEIVFETKGCEEFEINPMSLNLKSNGEPLTISLKPIKYSISGKVKTESGKISDLNMVAKSDSRQVDLELVEKTGFYEFNLMAFPGEEVIFLPQSAGFLFYPDSLHVFVDNDCHENVAIFEAKKGHFVKGQISPPVEGVLIKITNPEQGQKFVETLTDKSGKYSLGPLPQNDYKVEASKEGYVFEKSNDGFKSKKLASIHVEVKDNDKNDLNGVVISVSGGSFRSNTKSENGKAEFLSLAPGEYFIKPQLKEYEFNPKHKMQKLAEGENAQISWTAKRVAFSIYGKILSLNGQPEPGTTLRAVSKSCGDIFEEATSESDGTFRFRGLKPKCEYLITFMHGESIEKLIPKEVKVIMKEEDFKLPKPIVAMRAFETTDILLKITDDVKSTNVQNQPSNLKISVISVDGKFKFETKAITGQLIPLPKVNKDNKTYDIYVETVPTKFAPQKKVSHSFNADDYVKSIKLVLGKTAETQKQVRKVSSLVYLLPIVIGAVLSYLLWDQMPQFVKNWVESASNSGHSGRRGSDDSKNSAHLGSDGWDTLATPSGTKRRNKKR